MGVPSARAGFLRDVSAFSDPRWFDREAAVDREDVICRAVPQDDGGYIRHAETQSGLQLDVVTFRVCEGPLSGHHAGLLIWPPRNAADRERALGALASTPDDHLAARLADVAVRCRLETSPFGELEVRKLLEVVTDIELPEAAGPNPPMVREDLLPPRPPEPPVTTIKVLRTPDEVLQAVDLLKDQPVLGFDIETACTRLPPEQREDRAAFEPWNGTVRLVQSCQQISENFTAFVVFVACAVRRADCKSKLFSHAFGRPTTVQLRVLRLERIVGRVGDGDALKEAQKTRRPRCAFFTVTECALQESTETRQAAQAKSCNAGLGSAVYVTGTIGFIAAAQAIEHLRAERRQYPYKWAERRRVRMEEPL